MAAPSLAVIIPTRARGEMVWRTADSVLDDVVAGPGLTAGHLAHLRAAPPLATWRCTSDQMLEVAYAYRRSATIAYAMAHHRGRLEGVKPEDREEIERLLAATG